MFPISSLKTCNNCHTQLLIPFSRIYADLNLKPAYIGMCAKGQILLEVSLMWIRLTCLLAFHMPWDRSNSTFHYPIDKLYKEPFAYIEGIWEITSKRTIVHCCWNLCLSLHPLCPLEHFCVLPKLTFCLWACYWDGGLKWWRPKWGTRFLWFTYMLTEVVFIVISDFILIEISFPVQ